MPRSGNEASIAISHPDASQSLDHDEVCPASILTNENQLRSTATFEILQSQKDNGNTVSTSSEMISTTVLEMNADNDEGVSLDVGPCNEPDARKYGNYTSSSTQQEQIL